MPRRHRGRPIVNSRPYKATIYLRVPCLSPTNGLAERTIKELRRRIKTMDGLKSEDGSKNFLVLWIP